MTCGTACGTKTLAQAQAADPSQIVDSDTANVSALLAALPTSTVVPAADLLMALLPKEALPIEKVPTDAIVAASPLPSAGSAGYQIGFDMSCGAAAGLGVQPALPPGFRLIPGSVTMKVGTTATPVTVSPAGVITPTAAVSCTGVKHVTVALTAEPPAELGGPFSAGATAFNVSEQVSVSDQAPVTVVDGFTSPAGAGGAPAGRSVTSEPVYTGRARRSRQRRLLHDHPAARRGSAIVVTLSHLPADYDLVLYGPATASSGLAVQVPLQEPVQVAVQE